MKQVQVGAEGEPKCERGSQPQDDAGADEAEDYGEGECPPLPDNFSQLLDEAKPRR